VLRVVLSMPMVPKLPVLRFRGHVAQGKLLEPSSLQESIGSTKNNSSMRSFSRYIKSSSMGLLNSRLRRSRGTDRRQVASDAGLPNIKYDLLMDAALERMEGKELGDHHQAFDSTTYEML